MLACWPWYLSFRPCKFSAYYFLWTIKMPPWLKTVCYLFLVRTIRELWYPWLVTLVMENLYTKILLSTNVHSWERDGQTDRQKQQPQINPQGRGHIDHVSYGAKFASGRLTVPESGCSIRPQTRHYTTLWNISVRKLAKTSEDVGADMVCGRPWICYGLHKAWKFQTPTI